MTEFWLFRHAESLSIRDAKSHAKPKFGGRNDGCKLSDEGHNQSENLSTALVNIGFRPDAIMSSLAVRAVDTARPFAKACGLPVKEWKNLHELSWGDWEGEPRSIQDAFATERAKKGFNFRPPGGESLNDCRKRIMRELQLIQGHGYGRVAVFMHRNGIKNVVRENRGWKTPDEQDKVVIDLCSATIVEFETIHRLTVIDFNRRFI